MISLLWGLDWCNSSRFSIQKWKLFSCKLLITITRQCDWITAQIVMQTPESLHKEKNWNFFQI
jgi:hypothetical protein